MNLTKAWRDIAFNKGSHVVYSIVGLLCAFATTAPLSAQTPGQVDTTFAIADPENIARNRGNFSQAIGRSIAVQSDGKLLVAGECMGGNPDRPFCVARFNVDGTVDSAFGTNGIASTSFAGVVQATATSLAIQNDGFDDYIVVAGLCVLAFDANGPDGRPCYARFRSNGTLNSNPGTSGRVIHSSTRRYQGDYVGIVARSNRRLVLAGTCVIGVLRTCVVGYDGGDVPDLAFNSGNERDLAYFDGSTQSNTGLQRLIASRAGEGIYVAVNCGGTFGVSVPTMCVAKLDSSGYPDTIFASGGFARVQAGVVAGATSIVEQYDDKVVIAGTCTDTATFSQFCLARFNTNGTLDTGFAGTGRARLVLSSFSGTSATGLVLQNDGKLVAFSYCEQSQSSPELCVVRYRQDGTLDPSFGTLGVARQPYPQNSEFRALVLGSNEKLTIAGTCLLDVCVRQTIGGPFGAKQCSLDVDGDNVPGTGNDILLATRASMGFTGTAVVQGATFASHASRTSWPAIRDYLVSQCGMSLSP